MSAPQLIAVPHALVRSLHSAGTSPGSNDTDLFSRLSHHLATRGTAVLNALNEDALRQDWNAFLQSLVDHESSFWQNTNRDVFAHEFGLHPASLAAALDVSLPGLFLAAKPNAPTHRQGHSSLAAKSTKPAFVTLAGNVPVLMLQVLLPALLARKPVAFKVPSSSIGFHRAVLEELFQSQPRLGDAIVALSWDGPRDDGATLKQLTAATPGFDPILVYGGEQATQSYRDRMTDHTVFSFGPKTSVALVFDDDSAAPNWLQDVARDIALFEQRGCLSVTSVVLVSSPEQRQATVHQRAEQLARALHTLKRELPLPVRGPAGDPGLALTRHWIDAAIVGGRFVTGDLADGGTVIVGEAIETPPGGRTATLVAVPDVESALALVAERQRLDGAIQGVAVAGTQQAAFHRIQQRLVELGVSRVVAAGQLQATNLAWNNGGVDLQQVLAMPESQDGWNPPD